MTYIDIEKGYNYLKRYSDSFSQKLVTEMSANCRLMQRDPHMARGRKQAMLVVDTAVE